MISSNGKVFTNDHAMKQIRKHILVAAAVALSLGSCHDLEVPITTQLTPDIFPQTPDQFISAAGPTYNAFRQNYAVDYWFLQTLSTDEAILPARGGNWYDNGRYEQHHKHTWTPDNAHVNAGWNYLSSVISNVNQNISIIELGPDVEGKATSIAELRMMRAIALYFMMDLWGNVPIVDKFGDLTPPVTRPRADVFNFIESEVEAVLPLLNDAEGLETYGRPNVYTAYALLAKMYLNAGVYIGQDRNNDAIAACDEIIQSGVYQLESNYRGMFLPNNGPQIKEFIFAIPYDGSAPNGYLFYERYWLPRSLRAKYSLPFTPSAPMSTLPEFYAYFNDPNDVRNRQWLTGKQYLYNGDPVIVKTTKKGFDEDYSGADGGTALDYHVELTPEVIVKKPATFDLGNDEKAWNMGYRSIKFYPDSTAATRNQNNDMPIFRYSDILMMKAEAILRGGTETLDQTALSLVNELRAVRSTSPAWTEVTLETLYEERTREFAGENWHRNDMIRFGKFENLWGYKTDTDPNKRLFPIPTSAIQLNPLLQQNPGY
jgi:starch-binding outer membrane protein, SusD/RagB family